MLRLSLKWRCVGCLILGLLTNMAVAWAAAAWAPVSSVGPQLGALHLSRYVPSTWGEPLFVRTGEGFGLDHWDGTWTVVGERGSSVLRGYEFHKAMPAGSRPEDVSLRVIRVTGQFSGWPLRSFRWQSSGALVRPLAQWTDRTGTVRALGWRPIWSGLAANTAAFSVLVAIHLVAIPRLRTWRRVRRGCCGACGYSLAGLSTCPECGPVGVRAG